MEIAGKYRQYREQIGNIGKISENMGKMSWERG
jgi:hypothetical protein